MVVFMSFNSYLILSRVVEISVSLKIEGQDRREIGEEEEEFR
jgi:hypothetical protein